MQVFVAGEPAPFDFVSQQDAVGPAAGRRRATLKDRITAYHNGLEVELSCFLSIEYSVAKLAIENRFQSTQGDSSFPCRVISKQDDS